MNTITNSDREKLLRLINGDAVILAPKDGPEKLAGSPKNFSRLFEVRFTFRTKILVAVLCAELVYVVFMYVGGIMPRRPALVTPTVSGVTSAPEGTDAYKLIGVDWSHEPVALVEDAQDNKTYFLKKNGRMKDFTVIAVLKDSVQMSRGSQIFEIK